MTKWWGEAISLGIARSRSDAAIQRKVAVDRHAAFDGSR
jgi:hypothetical protein